MMAEDGIADYGRAKRKAARSLGFNEDEALPSNEEVEAELRIHQSLYQEAEHQDRLRTMRQTALEIMSTLEEFRPYLTGAVLDGTAGRYAAIKLDLFADSAKDVEIFLLTRNISYRTGESRRHNGEHPEAEFHMDWNDMPVTLLIYPLVMERHSKRPSHTDGSPGRARASAVAALLTQA
ncbi:MAG: hypothetical protein JSR19_02605 [Proteobacteria bacterium]|nr:hypothetical protein [Pseudomonadota bacterium]